VSEEEAERPELEAVRRLLAEARHDEPMPRDVAARMDRVLAGLSTGPAEGPAEVQEEAPVIALAAHRRRRAAALLVAAAAIVVGGVTAAQHLPSGSGGHATAGGSATDQKVSGEDRATGSEPPGKAPRVSASGGTNATLPPLRTLAGRVLVRPGHFSSDALSGRRVTGPTPGAPLRAVRLRRVPAGCVPAALRDAEIVSATYEGAPAALVYHAPAGTTQVVDLYVCGTSKPVRTVTLPTP
jgi:hypothetical protein